MPQLAYDGLEQSVIGPLVLNISHYTSLVPTYSLMICIMGLKETAVQKASGILCNLAQ